jgi:hypothetical protein
MIREKDKLLQLGVIKIVGTFNKALVAHQKDKFKHLKKQHPCNNKKNKGPKPSQLDFSLMVTKEKNLKVRRCIGIATFMGEMVMWSLNVLKIWKH